MDHKSTESNKVLSLTLSVFFHAAFVCTAAFLPLYLSSQKDKDVNELEVALVREGVAPETGSAELTPIEEPTRVVETSAPTPKAEVLVTQSVTKPAPKPVEAVKETPKKKPAYTPPPKRVMLADKAAPTDAVIAEEQIEEFQPIIEVGEQLNEDGVNTIATEDESATEVQAAVEEAPVTAAPAAVATAPSPAAETSPSGASSAAPIATQEKPQNFLTLKQAPGNKPPQYSREMRVQKLEGKGQLAYTVAKDGTVKDIKVNKSSGVSALDEAALAAFSKYKFVPGQEGYTVHNFEFTLQGPAEQDAARLRTTFQENSTRQSSPLRR